MDGRSEGEINRWHRFKKPNLGSEFSYGFNRREAQLEMFGMTVKNLLRGEALTYQKLVEPKPLE
jgi:hypothetical protein